MKLPSLVQKWYNFPADRNLIPYSSAVSACYWWMENFCTHNARWCLHAVNLQHSSLECHCNRTKYHFTQNRHIWIWFHILKQTAHYCHTRLNKMFMSKTISPHPLYRRSWYEWMFQQPQYVLKLVGPLLHVTLFFSGDNTGQIFDIFSGTKHLVLQSGWFECTELESATVLLCHHWTQFYVTFQDEK